ncbi:mono/diheme cytochrome c family protein [Silvimonas terrae]|uniref:Mono/diheme cytochrome c family protein n=1 Tax=Silvimonas terrae TaxID=300266 RepID=A0A840RKR0_9NEIS|nr:cytochrome c [Silvimonas terrae]MBB5192721.1 mono/diheme cytochrome c family protein [Silvimonas terrae]
MTCRLLRPFALAALMLVSALAQAAEVSPEQIKRGEYLARAADCIACHTVPRTGQPFAGGYGIASPLGTIYSSNITPSTSAGIGNYTLQDFDNALRRGIRKDGAHLYPAMPYTAYAKLQPEDVEALYAYLMHGVKPVDAQPRRTRLPFPFNIRLSMAVWNSLFLDPRVFQPEQGKSEDFNRGKYLVEALEHCSACHTPRNMLMAENPDAPFAGGQLGAWYAPNITADPVSGVGGWTQAELVQYLKTGHVAGKAAAAGPMAEAVSDSLSHLTDPDLQAMATYLKTIAPIRNTADSKPAWAWGSPANDDDSLRGTAGVTQSNRPTSAAELFSANCASCHQANGMGTTDTAYPSLTNNTALGHLNPSNLIAVILNGVDRPLPDGHHAFMPGFGPGSLINPLSDADIATLANYTLQRFGNTNVHVTPEEVAASRKGGEPPLLAKLPRVLPVVLMLFALLLILGGWRSARQRKLRHVARPSPTPRTP